MKNKYFKGTPRLLALLLRQNLLKIILWLIGIISVSLAVAFVYSSIYSSPIDIMRFGLTMQNPAMRALIGANYKVGDFNIGVIYASEMLLFTSIAVAIMNILIMKTSTRQDEEEGRLEIIQSLPVGKLSYLIASLILSFLVNLVLIVILTTALTVFGTAVFTFESSLLYSTILGVTGFVFAAFTAVAAQLTDTAHGTSVLAFGFLLLSYIIRMIGDVQNQMLSLLSPLGWTLQTEVFANDNWVPIFVLTGSSLILVLLAFYLRSRRDMFSGLLPARSGKSKASPFLKTTPGLVWTLEKGKLISWFLLLFLLSAAFGAILGEMESYFSEMEIIQLFLANQAGGTITEQFINLLIRILTIFSLIPGVMILQSLKKEEAVGRAEHFYSRAVTRNKMLFTYFTFALLTVILMQVAIATGLYSTAVTVLEEPIALTTFIQSALAFLPTIFLAIGLATLLVGALPRFTLAAWLYIVFMFIVLYLGDLLEFPSWIQELSALSHIPAYPHENLQWPVMIVLTAIGLVFTLIGFVGYNKRDIHS